MQWEHLTAPDFAKAVREVEVCILACGVLEKHSDHLPLGTDFLNVHKKACLAAEREPAVVFPPFYFGQIYEARCFPGALTIKPTLLIDLYLAVFDEIGRNGFKKIIIFNGHGGNGFLLPFLAQCSLWEEKPYSLYVFSTAWTPGLSPARRAKWNELLETNEHGHACEAETSITLANYPDSVKMEDVPDIPGTDQKRMGELGNTAFTGIGWYTKYPNHYAGDARPASAEKGRKFQQLSVDSLAEFIAAVKADTVVPNLTKEFFDREKELR